MAALFAVYRPSSFTLASWEPPNCRSLDYRTANRVSIWAANWIAEVSTRCRPPADYDSCGGCIGWFEIRHSDDSLPTDGCDELCSPCARFQTAVDEHNEGLHWHVEKLTQHRIQVTYVRRQPDQDAFSRSDRRVGPKPGEVTRFEVISNVRG